MTMNNLVKSVKFTGGIGVVGVFVPQDPAPQDPLYKQGEIVFDHGLFWFKGQSIGTGQCNVKAYNRQLRDLISTGRAKPSFIVSHELPLERGAEGLPALRRARRGLDQGGPQARRVTEPIRGGRPFARPLASLPTGSRIEDAMPIYDYDCARVRAVHGDAADGAVPRPMRLPGLRRPRARGHSSAPRALSPAWAPPRRTALARTSGMRMQPRAAHPAGCGCCMRRSPLPGAARRRKRPGLHVARAKRAQPALTAPAIHRSPL